jgi:hypothetical protein
MSTTTEITLEQLASVDAKMLMKALEMQLASAGVLKKRGVKKVAKTSSSSAASDDAASQSGRSVGEGTKKWNNLTTSVAALVKTALDGEKGGAGFHLKVLSYLKTEKSMSADTEPTLELVREAVTFLRAHPEWTSPNQKAKAAKTEPASDASSSSTGPVIVKSDAPAKPKGRPAKSEEEKAAAAAAKKAEKDAAAAAKKAEKDAAAAAKKAAKKPAAKKAAPTPAEAVTETTEDASGELVEIELDGVSYFWDEASGTVFDNIDGHTGDRIGVWNGTDSEITRD